MEWAAEQGLDTKTLKANKIPIYGKWYFPEIPSGVPLVNLKTGEIQVFGPGLRAGEILFVARSDLRRARLGPYAARPESEAQAQASEPSAAEPAAPAVAQAQPGSVAPAPRPAVVAARLRAEREEIPAGIHLPAPSIFPLVFAIGLMIVLLGLVVGPRPPDPAATIRPIIIGLGAIYLGVAATGWAIQNYREERAHEVEADYAEPTGV
jgi:hypothetical protein